MVSLIFLGISKLPASPDLPFPTNKYFISLTLHNKSGKPLMVYLAPFINKTGQSVLSVAPGQKSKTLISDAVSWWREDGYIILKFKPGIPETTGTYLAQLPKELKTELAQYTKSPGELVLFFRTAPGGLTITKSLDDKAFGQPEKIDIDPREDARVDVNVYVNGPNIENTEIDLSAVQGELKQPMVGIQ